MQASLAIRGRFLVLTPTNPKEKDVIPPDTGSDAGPTVVGQQGNETTRPISPAARKFAAALARRYAPRLTTKDSSALNAAEDDNQRR